MITKPFRRASTDKESQPIYLTLSTATPWTKMPDGVGQGIERCLPLAARRCRLLSLRERQTL